MRTKSLPLPRKFAERIASDLQVAGAVAFWIFNLKFETLTAEALKSQCRQPEEPRAKGRGFSLGSNGVLGDLQRRRLDRLARRLRCELHRLLGERVHAHAGFGGRLVHDRHLHEAWNDELARLVELLVADGRHVLDDRFHIVLRKLRAFCNCIDQLGLGHLRHVWNSSELGAHELRCNSAWDAVKPRGALLFMLYGHEVTALRTYRRRKRKQQFALVPWLLCRTTAAVSTPSAANSAM